MYHAVSFANAKTNTSAKRQAADTGASAAWQSDNTRWVSIGYRDYQHNKTLQNTLGLLC